jgi:hypothetical protein
LFTPQLTGITIYPVKSLDGVDVSEISVLDQGALSNDRRWRLVDDEGQVVNAKRQSKIQQIRSTYEIFPSTDGISHGKRSGGHFISLWVEENTLAGVTERVVETFPLVPGRDGPCEWLSDVLQMRVFLQENINGGFPDDCDASGPTLISSETLSEVASWFDLSMSEARRRFRTNLEISLTGEPVSSVDQKFVGPFWEDTLSQSAIDVHSYSASEHIPEVPVEVVDAGRLVVIGKVAFRVRSVCRRCVVPTRDSYTGVKDSAFRDIFEARRGQMLPSGISTQNWSSYFRLGVNLVPERGYAERGYAERGYAERGYAEGERLIRTFQNVCIV